MFKKVDKLIVKAFTGPFLLAFGVVEFIFLSQFMISKFKYFVGKDLGWDVFAELFFYFGLSLVPTALPLAMLFACLMTFGNLGQHSELTAIKGSGISLTRILRPVALIAAMITIVQVFYNDRVVPFSRLKAYSLLYDVRQKKPALDLTEGAFYDGLDGYSIKVEEKHDDNSIVDVIIYKHLNNRGNKEVVVADHGRMDYVFNNQYMKLTLFDGNSYTEVEPQDRKNKKRNITEYIRNEFDSAEFLFSLESFELDQTDEQLFAGHTMMKTEEQLLHELDSTEEAVAKYNNNLVRNASAHRYYRNKLSQGKVDTKSVDIKSMEDRLQKDQENAHKNVRIASSAYNSANSIKNLIDTNANRQKNQQKEIARSKLEIQKNYTQAVAIFVMFLIGAPLGAIVKKGGIGMPTIISVFFFVIYYVTTTTGDKYVKELLIDPAMGAWMSNALLAVIGFYFLSQARIDASWFDTDFYAVQINKIKSKFSKS